MGVAKATAGFEGRPLIEHAVGIFREAGLPVSISGARPDLVHLAPVVDDLGSHRGPLGGICGALQAGSASWMVFIPVDLPLLPPALVSLMLNTAYITGDAIVTPSANGFAQTFPAVLSRAVLPTLKAELESGRGGCFAAFQIAAQAIGQRMHVIAAELLAQTGQVKHPDGLSPSRWFFNINSATDLERAREFRHGRHALRHHFA